jgi:hypothetical protein
MSDKSSTAIPVLLSPKEAADKCRCSISYLAKARMTGDGPPFIKRGRSVLYAEPVLLQWLKARTRTSTSVVCALFALVKAISAITFMSLAM